MFQTVKKYTSALFLSVVLAACGGPLTYKQVTSPKAPGVQTEITADVNSNQAQTRLNLAMNFLPPPSTIVPTATTYVAWQRQKVDGVWVRAGGVVYSESDRKGTMKDITIPETSFEFQVTAEAKADVSQPSTDVIITQLVNK